MYDRMAKGEPSERAQAFRTWMAKVGTNTRQVALRSGVTYNTLASFVQGDTQSLKGENEEKIVAEFGESASVIFGGKRPPPARRPRTAPLLGLVGAGERLEALQFDNPEPVDLPVAVSDGEAYQVKGTSCLPVFEEGDVVITTGPVGPGRHFKRFCVVETADGEGFIKRVDKIEQMVDGSQQAWLSGTDEGEDAGVQIIKWAKPVVLRIIKGGR